MDKIKLGYFKKEESLLCLTEHAEKRKECLHYQFGRCLCFVYDQCMEKIKNALDAQKKIEYNK